MRHVSHGISSTMIHGRRRIAHLMHHWRLALLKVSSLLLVVILKHPYGMREVPVLHDYCLIQQHSHFCSLVTNQVLPTTQLLLHPHSHSAVLEGEDEVRPVLRVATLPHVLPNNWSKLFDDWLDDLHFDCSRGDRWQSDEEVRQGWSLSLKLIVIADNIGSSQRV